MTPQRDPPREPAFGGKGTPAPQSPIALAFVRLIRLTVALAATVLVAGSFARVGWRLLRHEESSAGQVQLTVLHWGDKAEDKIVADLVADFERLPENRHIRI